jgi:hypothetical protein
MCPIPNGFRGRNSSLYSCKIFDKKEILRTVSKPLFIVQVTKLVQFTQYNTFSKIPPSTSVHFATCVRTVCSISAYSAFVKMCGIFHNTCTMSASTVTTANWRMTLNDMRERRTILDAKSKLLYIEVALSRKPFGIGHKYIQIFFLFRMTDTTTSHNIDLSSWDTLYISNLP